MGIVVRPDIMRKWQEEAQQGISSDSKAIAAYFAEVRSQALERFRALLLRLEEENLQRWANLTKQAHHSFYISILMNVGLLLANVTIVVWGLLLLTYSSNLSQQVGGSMLAALSALALALSSKYWTSSVERTRKFYAQQTRIQAAFTGYMNRLAQLRLMFETNYSVGEITFDELERYQRILNDVTAQALYQIDPS